MISVHMGPDGLAIELYVDMATERVDSMSEVPAFHSFRQLLTDAVDDQYEVCGTWPHLLHLTGIANLFAWCWGCV